MKSQVTRGSETVSQRRVQLVGECVQGRDTGEEVEPLVRDLEGVLGSTPSVEVEARVVTIAKLMRARSEMMLNLDTKLMLGEELSLK